MLLKIAFRNLFRQKRRTILTLLTMVVGFILSAISISMSEGGYGNIIQLFTKTQTGHIQIHQKEYREKPSLYKTVNNIEEIEKTLKNIKEIDSFSSRVLSVGLSFNGNRSYGVRLVGIEPDFEKNTSGLNNRVTKGDYIDNSPNNDILISFNLAKNLQISVGDKLAIVSQAADGSTSNDLFLVKGVFGSEKNELDSNSIYMSRESLQNFLALEGRVHQIIVILNDYLKSQEITSIINRKLDKIENNQAKAESWEVVNESFYKTMKADQQGDKFIIFVIILVVVIGVLNTVLMSLLERKREFGILLAIGTKPNQIFLLIIYEILFLSLFAIAIGSIFTSLGVYYLSSVGIVFPEPISISGIVVENFKGAFLPQVYIKPTVSIVLSSIVAALIPAIRTARVIPIKAIKEN
ncbi:ABC transporter permease [bacterium]|nr:ABC transporter permease [bacterium]